jgi:hypothetical protein
MSIVKKSNPHDLTEDEIKFLEGSSVDPEIKQYIRHQKHNLGTRTTALRKVAAAAQADASALLALRDLADVRGEWVHIQQARSTIASLDARNRALEGQLARKDADVLALKAAPALAVHSED